MEALLWLIFGCLCLVGAVVVAKGSDQRWTSRVAVLGAASLLAGGVLLAIFVFSGDPSANGDGSRWSRRESHDLVYVSWAATALGAGLLFVLSRLSRSRWQVATGLLIGTALIVLQVVAATSQNLN
jgi:peptidoglycan/LPS O-acetylase OafA/YrhL